LKVDTLTIQHLTFTFPQILAAHNSMFVSTFGMESAEWNGFLRESSGIDAAVLAGQIGNIRETHGDLNLDFVPDLTDEEMRGYYEDPKFLPQRTSNRCLSPWTTTYIYPNGDVVPCLSYVAGNVRKDRFLDIWNGESFREFRRALRGCGSFPVCSRCCMLYRY
jgi:radical SAM protein with 4Fe4S-binding SPASM domain